MIKLTDNEAFDKWYDAWHAAEKPGLDPDLGFYRAIAKAAWDAARSETPAQPEGWKQVADVLERQVAWIDRDARHVAVVVKGREYILTLPPLPTGNNNETGGAK